MVNEKLKKLGFKRKSDNAILNYERMKKIYSQEKNDNNLEDWLFDKLWSYEYKAVFPRGLHLFFGDTIDEDTGQQYYFYVLGKSYDSALKQFIKNANSFMYRYNYDFCEDDTDIEMLESFLGLDIDFKAGVYMYDR